MDALASFYLISDCMHFFIPLSSDNNYFTNEGAHNIVYSMHVPEKKQQQQQQQLNRGNEIDVSVVAH